MERGKAGAGCLLSALLALLAVASPAPGAFPGTNGRIAFVSDRDGNREIYTVNPDGTGLTRLTENPASDFDPAWSPDGSKIAFASSREGPYKIYVMNADGRGVRRLTSEDLALDTRPAWSPDGAKVAFTGHRGLGDKIYTMNADGTGQARLTSRTPPDLETNAAWSPAGDKIAFNVFFTKIVTPYMLHTIAPDGTGERQLLFDGAAPNWSPDGARLAFVCCPTWTFQGDVYVSGADGTGPVALTANPDVFESSPAWSPDGTRITFARDVGASSDIYVMNQDGGGQTNITNRPGLDEDPDWQPLNEPQRSAYKNGAHFCKVLRDYLGEQSFRQRYGDGANAHGKCVSAG